MLDGQTKQFVEPVPSEYVPKDHRRGSDGRGRQFSELFPSLQNATSGCQPLVCDSSRLTCVRVFGGRLQWRLLDLCRLQ